MTDEQLKQLIDEKHQTELQLRQVDRDIKAIETQLSKKSK